MFAEILPVREREPTRERDKMFANMTFLFANGQRSRMGRNICDRDVGPATISDTFRARTLHFPRTYTENGVETSKFVQLPPNLKKKLTTPRQKTRQPNCLLGILQFIGSIATIHRLLKCPLSQFPGGRRPWEAILGSGCSKSWTGGSGLLV